LLERKANGQETDFVPTGGSQLQVDLQFELPTREAEKILRWSGKVFVTIPGKPATFEFGDLMSTSNKKATIGKATVTLEKARKNRDIYEVLVGVALESDGDSSGSFQGWSNMHEAYLLDKNNKRVEHIGWSTTRMGGKEMGFSYLFDNEAGLEGCKFMYRAPGSIVEQSVEFDLEDVPLP